MKNHFRLSSSIMTSIVNCSFFNQFMPTPMFIFPSTPSIMPMSTPSRIKISLTDLFASQIQDSDTESDTESEIEVIVSIKNGVNFSKVSSSDRKPEKYEPVFVKKKFTKFCDSIIMDTPCKHGNKCSFAHSEAQITPNECRYGFDCVHVSYTENGVYVNKKSKLCERLHHKETKSSYLNRIKAFNNVSPIEPLSQINNNAELSKTNITPLSDPIKPYWIVSTPNHIAWVDLLSPDEFIYPKHQNLSVQKPSV